VSSKLLIGYIGVRVFAHATEDPEKVLTAVRRILPIELGENTDFQKNILSGHHRNPILLFEAKLADKEALLRVLQKIGAGLIQLDREKLDDELKLHLDKQNLYLRFDKQFAYKRKMKFSQNDPIHFKIHFKNKSFEEIVEVCRKARLLP